MVSQVSLLIIQEYSCDDLKWKNMKVGEDYSTNKLCCHIISSPIKY